MLAYFGIRSRVFFAVAGVATAGLLLAATVVSIWLPRLTEQRLQRTLEAEARLLADQLARHAQPLTTVHDLDAEADRLGLLMPARVTLIAADGSVLGDSTISGAALAALENHGDRPEVIQATREGTGAARRWSETLRTEMLYVAARVQHPVVSLVRLSLPLAEARDQVAAIRTATLASLAVALVAAAILAALASGFSRRLQALAASARRYAGGDLSPHAGDYGRDELGLVARSLDDLVRQLATRVDELALARARTEAVLASMVEGVVVLDGQGHVEAVNGAARSMLGLDAEPRGAHYLELVRHPGVADLLAGALRGEQPPALELPGLRPGGRRLVARASPTPVRPEGGVLLVLHDITDLRQADQVRRDFVANVSHELRTPLTAIRGYVEALADDKVGPGDRERFLRVVARHVARMERLVTDLLRLASLDAHQEAVIRGECDLQALLDGIVADLAPAIDGRRQRVAVRVAPEAARVTTDAGKLQDAIRNLVENAVHYSPEGCAITLEAAGTDGDLEVRVLDEGPGVPEADLERIFERFYRVDRARSRESGGTGLGLSIVKHLVELLGGRVRAGNRPEGGAVFTVRLPRTAR